MTTAYHTNCTQLSHNEFSKAVSLLPKQMQERLRKYRRWQDAHAYLNGRLLLKEGVFQIGYNISLK